MLGFSPPVVVLTIPGFLNIFGPDGDEEASRIGLWVSIFNIPPHACYVLHINVSGYKLNHSWNSKYRNIHIIVLTYLEGMQSPFRKGIQCETLEDRNIYFTNSIPAI